MYFGWMFMELIATQRPVKLEFIYGKINHVRFKDSFSDSILVYMDKFG